MSTKATLEKENRELKRRVADLEALSGEGKKEIWAVKGNYNSRQYFPASDPDEPTLVLPAYQEVGLPDARWLENAGLLRAVRAGRVIGPYRVAEMPIPPEPIELPANLKISSPMHMEMVRQITSRPVADSMPYINMDPRDERTGRPDKRYLKEKLLPILEASLYIEERDKKRNTLIDALKKRIDDIETL